VLLFFVKRAVVLLFEKWTAFMRHCSVCFAHQQYILVNSFFFERLCIFFLYKEAVIKKLALFITRILSLYCELPSLFFSENDICVIFHYKHAHTTTISWRESHYNLSVRSSQSLFFCLKMKTMISFFPLLYLCICPLYAPYVQRT